MKIPKPIRNAPENGCYVCKRSADAPLIRCAGGCGLAIHAACEGQAPVKGKRKRKEEDAAAATTPPASHAPAMTGGFPITPSKASAPSDASVGCWQCGRCAAIVGATVFARLGNDSFFRRARVTARDRHDRVRIVWDPEEPPAAGVEGLDAPAAPAASSAASSGSASSSSTDGEDEGVWVSERHACMADVPADIKDLRRGARAVAVWLDGHAYACEVLGSAGRRQMAVQFEDGLQYDAPMDSMRTLLDEPLCVAPPCPRRHFFFQSWEPVRGTLHVAPRLYAHPPFFPPSIFSHHAPSICAPSFNNVSSLEALHGRGRLFDGASAQGPSAWSQRTVAKGVWCSDSAQCGPLQRTVKRLQTVWRGTKPGGKEWAIEDGGVDGLWVCADFLSIAEIEVFRMLFHAHNHWSLYNWGHVGKGLASILQRIDFGMPEMTAEGVAAAKSTVQPIGELQQTIISLLENRMRAAFGRVAWGGEDGPTHPDCRPNMLQFTRIAPGTCLGNHFDRRDKWDEGIASLAWSAESGNKDPRGDEVRARLPIGLHACMRAYVCSREISYWPIGRRGGGGEHAAGMHA